MTKKQEALQERADAVSQLRQIFPPGSVVSTVLRHVSRSGMQRTISVLAFNKERGEISDVSWMVAKALNDRFDRDRGGVKVGGCGMDMGFHLVNSLSYRIWGEYQCLGKDKCPSNYHVNHRDRINCEGTRVYNPDGEDTGKRCYKPDRWSSRFPVPEGWPMRDHIVTPEDGEPFTFQVPLACITDENDENPVVCPTCNGAGDLPNPEGPERFDLLHKDGYALRHRWV